MSFNLDRVNSYSLALLVFVAAQSVFAGVKMKVSDDGHGGVIIKAGESIFRGLSADPMLMPLAFKPNAQSYVLNIRVFDHGVKNPEALDEMITTTERLFSQCAESDVRIHVTNIVKVAVPLRPKVFESSNLERKKAILSREFLDALPKGPREAGVVDVHMVDFLSDEARESDKAGKTPAMTYEGKAFQSSYVRVHHEAPEGPLTGEEFKAVENSVLLAMHMYARTNGSWSSVADRKFVKVGSKTEMLTEELLRMQKSSRSLLAHELGHVLLETQNIEELYIDHFCPELGVPCPSDYMMASGGSNDRTFYPPKKDKNADRPVGFSPLPRLDAVQCEQIRKSPFFRKILF